jgi:hypothetical protein
MIPRHHRFEQQLLMLNVVIQVEGVFSSQKFSSKPKKVTTAIQQQQ